MAPNERDVASTGAPEAATGAKDAQALASEGATGVRANQARDATPEDGTGLRSKRPNVRQTSKGFETRLRFGRGQRRWFVLEGCPSPEAATRRAAQLERIAEHLRGANRPGDAEHILRRAAAARDAETLRTVGALARSIARGDQDDDRAPVLSPKTFRQIGEDWTDGNLHRQWPDHVRKIEHANNIVQLEAYVYPTLGDLRIADIRREHCDRPMRTLPAHLGPNSRKHVAQLVSRVLTLAAFAGYTTHNPLPRGWVPRKGPKKDVPVLYPSEDAALLACLDVPLLYRLYYGVLHREGGRRTETAALTWAEIDLENGVIQLDKNKTDHARWWKADPGVVDAFRAWHELRGKPTGGALVFVTAKGEGLETERMAETIRVHLERADVKRARLFAKGKNTVRFGTHGFRHSFTTRSLAGGKTDDWVRQRTGHRSTELLTYREAARSLGELELGDVAPLAAAIPELAAVHARRMAQQKVSVVLSPGASGPEGGPQGGHLSAHLNHVAAAKSAEREGFEPSEPLRAHMISNHAPSTTRSPLPCAPLPSDDARKACRSRASKPDARGPASPDCPEGVLP